MKKWKLAQVLIFVFLVVGCGNNTPTSTTNSYEYEVVGNNISGISYVYNSHPLVQLGDLFLLPPITTTDWTYSFQTNSGGDCFLDACSGNPSFPVVVRVWKNGTVVESASNTICAEINGTLP